MAGFLRVLLATDFGKAAELARADAAMLARAYRVPVDLVHVQASHPRTATSAAALEARTRQHLNECRRALLEADAKVGDERVALGSAAEAVLHTAEALDSSLIVIGAGDHPHGEPGTGPTAETIARFARQPVWISRARREPGLARVMVAVDCSDASREALLFASDFCERFSATPTVVHVLEHLDFSPGADTSNGELGAHAATTAAALSEFVERAHRPNLAGALRTAWGEPAGVLRALALEEKTDLLIVGRTGLGGLRRVFLGGTAERLLRSAPCSLLLTSPAGPS